MAIAMTTHTMPTTPKQPLLIAAIVWSVFTSPQLLQDAWSPKAHATCSSSDGCSAKNTTRQTTNNARPNPAPTQRPIAALERPRGGGAEARVGWPPASLIWRRAALRITWRHTTRPLSTSYASLYMQDWREYSTPHLSEQSPPVGLKNRTGSPSLYAPGAREFAQDALRAVEPVITSPGLLLYNGVYEKDTSCPTPDE